MVRQWGDQLPKATKATQRCNEKNYESFIRMVIYFWLPNDFYDEWSIWSALAVQHATAESNLRLVSKAWILPSNHYKRRHNNSRLRSNWGCRLCMLHFSRIVCMTQNNRPSHNKIQQFQTKTFYRRPIVNQINFSRKSIYGNYLFDNCSHAESWKI